MNFLRSYKYSFKYRKIKNVISPRSYCECLSNPLCKPDPINPQNLPLLPIPKLEHTLRKLLRSAEPFVTLCELINCKDVCQKFMKCEGYKLQQYLIDKGRRSHNWIDDWFKNYAYLCNRDSLPMGTSTVLTFPTRKFNSRCDQIDYTAKLILGVLKFREISVTNRLPLDTRGKYPLDMSIYRRIFSNIRLPKPGCDKLVHHSGSQHIVVMFKNNFFKLRVLNDAGEPLSYDQLMTRLEEIVKSGTISTPLGILTALKRDKWAKSYKLLSALPDNDKYLDIIEKALCVVCIDEASPTKVCSEKEKNLISLQNGFHGHGPKINGSNRWYDKTLQFYVDRSGNSGIIFEHSPVEALPLAKLTDFVANYIKGKQFSDIPFIDMCDKSVQLNFITSSEIQCAIEDACEHINHKMDHFCCDLLHFEKYGKEFCKDNDLSSDGIVQLALQFAYFRTHDHFTPQYESATTRKFYLGRREIVRSCTCEAIQFIKSCNDPLLLLRDKIDALRNAVSLHRCMIDDAMEGRGIDCHLFGLLMAAKETGRHVPKLFRERAFRKAGKFGVISRQNPMVTNCFMGYPPGETGGYGVCYNPRAEDINMCVTGRKNDGKVNVKHFIDGWSCSMKCISDILCSYERRKTKLC